MDSLLGIIKNFITRVLSSHRILHGNITWYFNHIMTAVMPIQVIFLSTFEWRANTQYLKFFWVMLMRSTPA